MELLLFMEAIRNKHTHQAKDKEKRTPQPLHFDSIAQDQVFIFLYFYFFFYFICEYSLLIVYSSQQSNGSDQDTTGLIKDQIVWTVLQNAEAFLQR
jgi:hypothetical protein